MSKFLILLSLLIGVAATAEVAAHFKNFAPGRDGMWETTTTTALSPKPNVQRNCVDAAKSKEMLDKMLSSPSPMTKCTVKIVVDTKDAAETEQICTIANITTKLSMKMKKISNESFESVVETDTAGRKTNAKMVTKYVGPCSAAEKNAQAVKLEKQCGDCKSSVEQMKTRCKAAKGPEQQMCGQSIQQIEAMCKMSCR